MDLGNFGLFDRVDTHENWNAVEKAAAEGEFSRKAFPGNHGLRNKLGIGVTTVHTRTPEKAARLFGQASDLAEIMQHPRRYELAHQRDQATLTALKTAKKNSDNLTLDLNGRRYALLEMGNQTYRSVDVSDTDCYELTNSATNGAQSCTHLIRHGEKGDVDLGQVIPTNADISGWIGLATDGSIADPDLSKKIKSRLDWKIDHTDESARAHLASQAPGVFEFYPSNREGFHKIAYKNFDQRICIQEFDQHTGKLATDESTNIFSLMQSLRDHISQRNELAKNMQQAPAKGIDKRAPTESKPTDDSTLLAQIKENAEQNRSYTDDMARDYLIRQHIGEFELYPSDRNGFCKIAYKDLDRRIFIAEFSSTTGSIDDSKHIFEDRDIFSLNNRLQKLRKEGPPKAKNQIAKQ